MGFNSAFKGLMEIKSNTNVLTDVLKRGKNGYWHLQMVTGIYKWLLASTNGYWHLQMVTGIYKWLLASTKRA